MVIAENIYQQKYLDLQYVTINGIFDVRVWETLLDVSGSHDTTESLYLVVLDESLETLSGSYGLRHNLGVLARNDRADHHQTFTWDEE